MSDSLGLAPGPEPSDALLPKTSYAIYDECWIVLGRDEASGKLTKGRVVAAITLPWHTFDFYLIEIMDRNALHIETRNWLHMAHNDVSRARLSTYMKNAAKVHAFEYGTDTRS